jgi:sulfate adenylyltransferase subunit 2
MQMQIATPNALERPDLYGLDGPGAWDTHRAFETLRAQGLVATKRTTERRLHELGLLPPLLNIDALRDSSNRPANRLIAAQALEMARRRRRLALFVQKHALPNGQIVLHANDARGGRYWVAPNGANFDGALEQLATHIGKPITLFTHGELAAAWSDLEANHLHGAINIVAGLHASTLPESFSTVSRLPRTSSSLSKRLKLLEAESIHIIREAIAEADRPVMLFSIGKDSGAMLHLARKAFYPAPPPFPLLHVDTRWKFRDMYAFRDRISRDSGQNLIVHVNPEAIERDINPFDHGSSLHTEITKTVGLKQALDAHRFDVIFGGARRDEEKSRAKERIFSFRTANHGWDPKRQRPELWNLYNTRKQQGESLRVFPLSNWTELDVWQYTLLEEIPVVPLYFAAKRPIVQRDGMLIMVDDDRFRLQPGERIEERVVRFRSLGCYPLSGAIESTASRVQDIVNELQYSRASERQGRAIDQDPGASMEQKKREGYF